MELDFYGTTTGVQFQSRDKNVLREREAMLYQVRISTERIRVPEIVFQPCIVGQEKAGLAELLDIVIAHFDPAVQSDLAKNVFVCGGNTHLKGFVNRVQREITQIRPINSQIGMFTESSVVDAWKGGALFSTQPVFRDSFNGQSITKALYEEYGIESLLDSHPELRFVNKIK